MLLLLFAAAWAVPTPPDLRVEAAGWLVEGVTVELGPSQLALERGYAFPLVHGGRTVGFAWAGQGRHRVEAAPELDLLGTVRRELGREPAPGEGEGDGLGEEAGAWVEASDGLWAFGPGAVALLPARGEQPGWTPLRAVVETEGAEGSLVVVDDRAVRAALAQARAQVAERVQALGVHGYPLALALDGPDEPGRVYLEAHLDLPVSRLAGNDAGGAEPWVGVAAADPWLAPDAVLSFAFGRRAAWTTGDV